MTPTTPTLLLKVLTPACWHSLPLLGLWLSVVTVPLVSRNKETQPTTAAAVVNGAIAEAVSNGTSATLSQISMSPVRSVVSSPITAQPIHHNTSTAYANATTIKWLVAPAGVVNCSDNSLGNRCRAPTTCGFDTDTGSMSIVSCTQRNSPVRKSSAGSTAREQNRGPAW